MIKTILISTDYSLESLNVLKKVLKEKNDENKDISYNIILSSGYEMGDSIRDLLFTTKHIILNKINSTEYKDACTIIENKYPNLINKIVFDVFTGNYQRSFNNYVEALQIEEAYFSNIKTKRWGKKFDLAPYIKKHKTLYSTEILVEAPQYVPEKGRLAEVFL